MIQTNQDDSSNSITEIKNYLYIFLYWSWLIVLFGLIGGAIGYYSSIQVTPIYETSTRLLVSQPPASQSINNSGIVSDYSLTSTYAIMLVDRPVLQGVIEQLNLPLTSDDLKLLITVKQIANSQLLEVTVRNANPITATDIANTIAAVFSKRMADLQAERYAATRDGLAQRMSEMEKMVSDTSNAIVAQKQALGISTDTSVQTTTTKTDPNTNTTTTTTSSTESPQLLELEARLTQYQSLYSEAVTSFEQVRMAEAQTSTNVYVSETASVPREPINSNTVRTTLLGLAVGAMLAVGIVFAVEFLDDTIKNPEEIRQRFNLPVLGVIAHHKIVAGKPISIGEPRSPVVEAFRTLRTNVTFAGVDTPLRRIIITSSVPQEGKTTISSNLAAVLAQGDKKVVLIDADLRRPQVHNQFGLSNRMGLTNLFVRQGDGMAGIIQTVEYPQLSIITSGSSAPNPSELLTSKRMTQVLDRLNQDFDMIILDTPPVLSVTDAAAMAATTDGVILVAKTGVTKFSALAQSLEQFNSVGARVLGIVLNDIKPDNMKYGYYYSHYYSKYSNYYGKDEVKRK